MWANKPGTKHPVSSPSFQRHGLSLCSLTLGVAVLGESHGGRGRELVRPLRANSFREVWLLRPLKGVQHECRVMPMKGTKSYAHEGCWLCSLHPTHGFSISMAREDQGRERESGSEGIPDLPEGSLPRGRSLQSLAEPGRDLRGILWGLGRVKDSSLGPGVRMGGGGWRGVDSRGGAGEEAPYNQLAAEGPGGALHPIQQFLERHTGQQCHLVDTRGPPRARKC